VVTPNTIEREAAMYEWTMSFLRSAGYEQYEVSSFARPGCRSRHNQSYWRHVDYTGWGPSAHSFRNDPEGKTGRRWWNVAILPEYLKRIRNGGGAVASGETLGEREMINEKIFLGLRSDGLDCTFLKNTFGVNLCESHPLVFERLAATSLATWDGNTLRLTDRGYLLCDEIAGYFMLA
jgi:oxygen-independent coproporphyrinogen-3 oxidase